jgi:hypothetical protein
MASKASIAQFQRALNARYEQFNSALELVVTSIATFPNDNERQNAAGKLQRAAIDLTDYLHEADRPEWLKQILKSVNRYLKSFGPESAAELIRTLMEYKTSIKQIIPSDIDADFLNFDNIFRKYRDECRLPELFDNLIAAINQIIESGEVDSVDVLNALQRCVDILRANRDGSFLAVTQGVSVARVVKQLVYVYLEKIPVIKDVREAYSRAVAELENGVAKLNSDIRDETLAEFRKTFAITKRVPTYGELEASFPEPKVLTYDEQAGVIEGEFTVNGDGQ